jgi:cobalamin biosynthesis protein CobD/CbiB
MPPSYGNFQPQWDDILQWMAARVADFLYSAWGFKSATTSYHLSDKQLEHQWFRDTSPSANSCMTGSAESIRIQSISTPPNL